MSFFGLSRAGPDKPLFQRLGEGSQHDGFHPINTTHHPHSAKKWGDSLDPIRDETKTDKMQDVPQLRSRLLNAKIMKAYATPRFSSDVTPQSQREFADGMMHELGKQHIKKLEKEVDEDVENDFSGWLLSYGHKPEVERYIGKDQMDARYKKKPLSTHSSVTNYIDSKVDSAIRFEKAIAKLKLRYEASGSLDNATIDECWMYYKFVVRGMEPSDEETARLLKAGDVNMADLASIIRGSDGGGRNATIQSTLSAEGEARRQAELDQLIRNNADLQARMDSLQTNYDRLRGNDEDLDEMRRRLGQAEDEKAQLAETLKAQTEETRQKLEEAQQKKTEMEGEMQKATEEIERQKQIIADLERQRGGEAQEEQAKVEMQQKFQGLARENKELASQMEEANKRLMAALGEKEEMGRQLITQAETINGLIDELHKTNSEANKALATKEQEVVHAMGLLDETRKSVTHLQNKLKDASNEIDALKASNQGLSSENESLRASLAAHENELQQAKSNVDAIAAELQKKGEELESHKRERQAEKIHLEGLIQEKEDENYRAVSVAQAWQQEAANREAERDQAIIAANAWKGQAETEAAERLRLSNEYSSLKGKADESEKQINDILHKWQEDYKDKEAKQTMISQMEKWMADTNRQLAYASQSAGANAQELAKTQEEKAAIEMQLQEAKRRNTLNEEIRVKTATTVAELLSTRPALARAATVEAVRPGANPLEEKNWDNAYGVKGWSDADKSAVLGGILNVRMTRAQGDMATAGVPDALLQNNSAPTSSLRIAIENNPALLEPYHGQKIGFAIMLSSHDPQGGFEELYELFGKTTDGERAARSIIQENLAFAKAVRQNMLDEAKAAGAAGQPIRNDFMEQRLTAAGMLRSPLSGEQWVSLAAMDRLSEMQEAINAAYSEGARAFASSPAAAAAPPMSLPEVRPKLRLRTGRR